jgi:FkbM family methyltransferase
MSTANPFPRRLGMSVRKRIARLTWTGDHRIVRHGGLLLLLGWRNYVDRQIAFRGGFEEAQIARLLDAMRRQGGCDLFLDIGANSGLYSLRVAASGLARRVVAFEPDRRNLHQLCANLYLNNLSDRVETVEAALSDRAGTIEFRPAPPTSTGQSRIAAPGEAGARRVRAETVDGLLGLSGQTIFAKIDVEGHEAAVLAGMARTLDGNHVFLQVECFPSNLPRVTEMLAAHGLRHAGSIEDDHYFTNITA